MNGMSQTSDGYSGLLGAQAAQPWLLSMVPAATGPPGAAISILCAAAPTTWLPRGGTEPGCQVMGSTPPWLLSSYDFFN